MRTLAMSRYRRNHELMEEALYHAAFGACLSPWRMGFTDGFFFLGPEKTQAEDDEADLEKLQELLVSATTVVFVVVLGLAVLRFTFRKKRPTRSRNSSKGQRSNEEPKLPERQLMML
jgi:hypothetical protein